MAKKGSRKSRAKKAMALAGDTERNIPLYGTDGTGTASMVQVDKVLSEVNMRLYRQSMTYPVSFRIANEGITNILNYKFYTLANNWFTMGAVRFAFRNWRMSIQDELGAGAPVGSWVDFRMSTANPDGDNDVLRGATFDGDGYNALDTGQYSISRTSIDDGTDKFFHLFGTLGDSYNIFTEYAKHLDSRKPDEKDIVVGNVYSGLSDADDSVREQLVESFDKPPYPQDLSGTNWADAVFVLQDSLTARGNSGISSLTSRTFDAPLGVVFIVKEIDGTPTDLSATVPELILRVKAGNYKGVAAHPIVRFPKDLRLATAKSNR